MVEPASSVAEQILSLTQRLLDAIDRQDWSTYEELCDPSLTACEPEALGHRVCGLEFHHYYFRLEGSGRPRRSEIVDPHVRQIGDAVILSYVRLVQSTSADGSPRTDAFEETRVWQKMGVEWRHVHFHRSVCGRWSAGE